MVELPIIAALLLKKYIALISIADLFKEKRRNINLPSGYGALVSLNECISIVV